MKPPKTSFDPQGDLFKTELDRIIDMNHELVHMAKTIDGDRLEETFARTYCEDNGRPGKRIGLMIGLHYLKYAFDMSDEAVVCAWVENPYWQYFSGMQYFCHEAPIDPSVMTRFRQRIGETGAEELLKETITSGLKLKAIKTSQLKRVNVDTTVQEKNIRHPTDARLYDRSRERLVKAAKAEGIALRQNYNRKAKEYLLKQSRYAHARQMKRAARMTKKLRTILGRVIRDIERKRLRANEELDKLLEISKRIHEQQRQDQGKVYSVHEPAVECICKGKAHKHFEFGSKVSIAVTSKGGWLLGAQAWHGNPYDGHTLSATLEQVGRLSMEPEHVFVDRGYRGHKYTGAAEVHMDRQRRGGMAKSLWKWLKRRAAVEPTIGHLKQEHRMDCNRLKGTEGDCLNAILSAAGMNFLKLLKHAAASLFAFIQRLLEALRMGGKFLFNCIVPFLQILDSAYVRMS